MIRINVSDRSLPSPKMLLKNEHLKFMNKVVDFWKYDLMYLCKLTVMKTKATKNIHF